MNSQKCSLIAPTVDLWRSKRKEQICQNSEKKGNINTHHLKEKKKKTQLHFTICFLRNIIHFPCTKMSRVHFFVLPLLCFLLHGLAALAKIPIENPPFVFTNSNQGQGKEINTHGKGKNTNYWSNERASTIHYVVCRTLLVSKKTSKIGFPFFALWIYIYIYFFLLLDKLKRNFLNVDTPWDNDDVLAKPPYSLYVTLENFPNPFIHPSLCNRNGLSYSYLCDPNKILSRSTADKIEGGIRRKAVQLYILLLLCQVVLQFYTTPPVSTTATAAIPLLTIPQFPPWP